MYTITCEVAESAASRLPLPDASGAGTTTAIPAHPQTSRQRRLLFTRRVMTLAGVPGSCMANPVLSRRWSWQGLSMGKKALIKNLKFYEVKTTKQGESASQKNPHHDTVGSTCTLQLPPLDMPTPKVKAGRETKQEC